VTSAELLTEAFDRVRGTVHRVVDGLTAEQLVVRLGEDANSIAWLVWHLTRIQDHHIADVTGLPQVWLEQGFAERFGLPLDPTDTGYGHTSADVAKVRVAKGESLTAYHDAVYQQTVDYVGTLTDADLPRVVDKSWDPPVTLAVRLISVISDNLQHVGQAAFVRGLLG
jgi:uncharacterized damage-inducible protein DinB